VPLLVEFIPGTVTVGQPGTPPLNQAVPAEAALTVRNVGIATAAKIAAMKSTPTPTEAITRTLLATLEGAVEAGL
jgi:hypothetical protein